jgi:hypothetical protein
MLKWNIHPKVFNSDIEYHLPVLGLGGTNGKLEGMSSWRPIYTYKINS